MVVAIIGILSSVALPKFANMVRKSREAQTKGNLGALRSALTIYYSENEGHYPATMESLFLGGKYMGSMPAAWTFEYGYQSSINNGI